MFVALENIVCTLKWPSLIAKIRKQSNQNLVGLTPEQEFRKEAQIYMELCSCNYLTKDARSMLVKLTF